MRIKQSVHNRRSPHGERGLKYLPASQSHQVELSLPTRGAWIEIWTPAPSAYSSRVAPHTGSVDWNWSSLWDENQSSVAPHTGSVDWNFELRENISPTPGRSPHGERPNTFCLWYQALWEPWQQPFRCFFGDTVYLLLGILSALYSPPLYRCPATHCLFLYSVCCWRLQTYTLLFYG